MRGGRAAGALAALASALLLAACGGDGPAPVDGALGASANMQTASCREWRTASPRQRAGTVDRLEEIVAGPRGDGTTLPDGIAYETLDARCGQQFARGFLLYELYIRAAGFRSLAERAK